MTTDIIIRGARVHNLKNISLTLPRNTLIVVTGVSGSGKSSLAFDTIYAEGQRRYVESLSSYARQFLERMDKPDVDLIQGISPAMAIEQRTTTRNPRSTVGTSTEVNDYLRLLFARIGKTFCKKCGRLVTKDSVESILTALAGIADGDASLRILVTFPLAVHAGEKLAIALGNLKKEGFFRVIVGGEILDINEQEVPRSTKTADVLVLVDRLVYHPGEVDPRLTDSLETAFASGNGHAEVVLLDKSRTLRFNQIFACPDCHIVYEEPDPRMFSFNNPVGACPECQGFGRAIGIDMDKIVPDTTKSLDEGAIQPWTTPKFREWYQDLARAAPGASLRLNVPFKDLSAREVTIIMDGHGQYEGLKGFFAFLEKKAYKIYYRVLLSRYRGYTTCPMCNGARLRPAALLVKVQGRNMAEVTGMTIGDARRFIESLSLTSHEMEIARRILAELKRRLSYLDDVGIGYLTLDRLSTTLSGGESQRINLATSLGSSLVGALYVLDEPSIGLHPRDNGRLIAILQKLRDIGNTVMVVEHDADMMLASDILVDMGPFAGERGGEIVACGPVEEVKRNPDSLTGAYLSGAKSIRIPSVRRHPSGEQIRIKGASMHNLQDLDLVIPLHMLVCVTGVSGSGKSTLVHTIVADGLKRALGDFSARPGTFRSIEGYETLSAVELVDQSPIGRTPRSNPVTYIGAFDAVRALYASTQAAKIQGFQPGAFSFNVPGGRCEACEGDGVVKVEMQFLADLYLPCDVCKGKRYKAEVLEVRYREKNIDDVLRMTVTEAIAFFGAEAQGRKIARKLTVLEEVGLGYVRLGQAATTLSGGEAQRVKLAAHLDGSRNGRHTLFILDEPTTGLHFDDIARLLQCFNALIEAGNSVLLIEHNLDVVKSADWVIDLGPEAGAGGGKIVAVGPPEKIAASTGSHTGRYLKPLLRKPA
ncbi:MAG: excinuclease ABC subunit UvrA [Bacteroidota bacterium]